MCHSFKLEKNKTSKSLKTKDLFNFSNFIRELAGTYELYVDVECDEFKCYNASVFRNPNNGIYLYRSKYGDWVFGRKYFKISFSKII